MKTALERGAFPSFSIISGRSGIGKTTLAYILTKSLLCENPVGGVSCERCATCMKITTDVMMHGKEVTNLHVFRMSDQGGKIAARDVEQHIMSKPIGQGKKKVILLEECQGMFPEAQALLLPRLESLPENVHIIAMTTDTGKLLDTFKGRATPYRLASPSQTEVTALLNTAIERLGIKVSGNAVLNRIVEYGIRPRDSLNLLLKLAQGNDVISMVEVNELLNLQDDSVYLRYLRAVKSDMGAVLDFIDMLKYNDTELSAFVQGLNKFLMRLLTFKYRKAFIQESIIEQCKEFLMETDETDLLKIQSIIAEEAIKFGSELHDEALLVSMSFKIQSRNIKNLERRAIRSVEDVKVEQEEQLANLTKKAEEAMANSADGFKVSGDIMSLISKLPNAKLIEDE